jgi:hypothetical protein
MAESLACSRYDLVCIDWQLMWYHWLHVSHTIPLSCHVTGWSHVLHGYTVSFVSEHPGPGCGFERRLIYRRLINHLAYLSMMLILISNDVNPHPGPGCSNTNETVYPCGTCDQPVTWQERGIVSDTCNQWYHISCESMQTKSYLEHANDSAIAWDCIMCNCPNYSTFCYSLVFRDLHHLIRGLTS